MPETATEQRQAAIADPGAAGAAEHRLRAHVETLERRLRKRDEQRRAMLHIMGDLSEFNKRLANQRKAMLHVLADYEQDRRRLARQQVRLDNSRRAPPPTFHELPPGKQPLEGHPHGTVPIQRALA